MTIVEIVGTTVYLIVAIVLLIVAIKEIIIPTSKNGEKIRDILIISAACLFWPSTMIIYILFRLLRDEY